MRESSDVKQRVLDRLAELDRNQAWLARQMRREQYVIHRWLNGFPFPDEDRRLMAAVLGKPVDWLLEPADELRDASETKEEAA